jgi:outer membrane protein
MHAPHAESSESPLRLERRPAMRRLTGSILTALCALCVTAGARAERKPLWEFGMGIGAIGFADYRGADTSHVYPLPVPYLIYRGRIFKADREGLRGLLFNQEFAELNISLNATTPVHSSSSGTRHGMPDLKPTLEAGPSLDLHLWRSSDRRFKFDIRLPLRAALTLESSPRAIGWQFTPRLAVDVADVAGHNGWDLGLLAGPLYAERRYNEYFYSVAPQFSDAQRPTYRAAGGFSGVEALAALSKRYPGFWVGTYVRYGTLSDAVFAPSPLVKRNTYWSAGVGIAWMISKSSHLVDTAD